MTACKRSKRERKSGDPTLFFILKGRCMGIGFDPKKEYEDIVETAAANLGFSVYEKSIRLKGDNSRIIVKIDALTPISHDDCAKYSRELSRILDEKGTLPNYVLEISSPGLDRKLLTKEEYKRFAGSPVKVIYEDNGGKCAKGNMLSAGDDAIIVLSDGREITIQYSAIKSAHLDY